MSSLKLKKAIETAIAGMTPAIDTVYENTQYTPVVGRPYQIVWFIGFIANNQEYGDDHQLQGYFQIDLMYPLLKGTGDILTRAELIKNLFKNASSFAADGVTVNIVRTPDITPGRSDGDRWKISIKVYYSAWIIVI